MDLTTQPRSSGSYTANLVGNIRSHLAGLQGYDVMALELIQNADDAKAAEIVFDITKEGLLVHNNSQFTYCGDMHNRPCGFIANNNYSCDYHRIADVGSGGKLSRGENIGRFGIGFVSTYQITDHPEIRSSGIKLTLYPEEGQWFIEKFDTSDGTSFFLPWADDPNTVARLALGVSHVSEAHIDQLTEDFQRVLRKSLLFLRHVQKAEVWRNGELLLACDMDRSDGSDLIVSFRPSSEVEKWHILRSEATEAAERLYLSHPHLKTLGRSTKISIGLRIDLKPLGKGLLYAFLPTEQSAGLPLHINADFFPESDRKAVIFAGHQHEHAWNEMLIDTAAIELARTPESLLQMLGNVAFWQLLERAYELSKPSNHPTSFKQFWERMKSTATQSCITLAQDGNVHYPRDVYYPDIALNAFQVKTIGEIGGLVVVDQLRPFRNAIIQLGAQLLTFESLVNLLEQAMLQQVAGEIQVDEERLKHFYLPLWSMVNDLLPDAETPNKVTKSNIQRLLAIPFVLSEDLYIVTMNQSYLALAFDARRSAALLPCLAIASHYLAEFPRIARLIKPLELGAVVSHISSMCTSETVNDVLGVENASLRDLYTMLAELDKQSSVDKTVYQTLRDLPIWLSSRGLIKATEALLPGNFNDPTGQTDLLDPSVLTDTTREFVSNKLGVQSQTIQVFVKIVLPKFFDESGPIDPPKYQRLVTELASHPSLIDDDDIRKLLASLPLIPTQDGNWSTPGNTYRRTDELVKVLGDTNHLWIDQTKIPNSRPVISFLNDLGICISPIAGHLVERMLYIAAQYKATEDARRASSEAFYVLCDQYDEWKDKKLFQDAIAKLKDAQCLPACGNDDQWYGVADLYAPYRSDAFKSQAHILDFKNTARLKTNLLEELGVAISPETDLVIKHLLYCVEHGVQPHVLTYQVLNERAIKGDAEITKLRNTRCIYVESQKSFVRPNQLYWTIQQLGRYAFTIPPNLEHFKPLFTAIGVKNTPDTKDFVDLLLDVVGGYYEQCGSIEGVDHSVYEACISGISTADNAGEIDEAELQRLQKSPSILNLLGRPTHPDELLLQDSEWHAAFFGGELNLALCKPAPEFWPLLEHIGVRRLSECAEVALEFVDGEKKAEAVVAEKLLERAGIIARLLHDKSTSVRKKVTKAFSNLTAFSHDTVRIQATVNLGVNAINAPPSAVRAYYDIDLLQLILARPVGERSWAPLLNALFHQMMPEEPGSEISKLTLSIRPLMGMTVEEAHRELTDAGIPHLDLERIGDHDEDLTSSELEDIGGTYSPAEELDEPPFPDRGDVKGHQDDKHQPQPTKRVLTAQRTDTDQEKKQNEETKISSGNDSRVIHPSKDCARKKRQKHKEQWDRRLLSYVRMNPLKTGETEDQENLSAHNLAVEVMARSSVCAYEKERGRIAEQMAQTHPGYDVISRNLVTGEERFIEVKGVNGEWNQTGVGLTRLQFSNAQDYGDRYWLYVVEFVSDPDHTRVHPICNPATQVTSFMFDGNWRDAVSDERADPALAFIAGARVKHQDFGYGRIVSMELRGSTHIVLIDFETGVRRLVVLNFHTMIVIEDDEDDNNDNNHS